MSLLVHEPVTQRYSDEPDQEYAFMGTPSSTLPRWVSNMIALLHDLAESVLSVKITGFDLWFGYLLIYVFKVRLVRIISY